MKQPSFLRRSPATRDSAFSEMGLWVAWLMLGGGFAALSWAALFPRHFFLSLGLGFFCAWLVIALFERWSYGRREQAAQLLEARYRAWLERVNRLASQRGYHNWSFDRAEQSWRAMWEEGLTPGDAIARAEGEDV